MKKAKLKSISIRTATSTKSARAAKGASHSLSIQKKSLPRMPWSNFSLSSNTLMRMRKERFGEDQISRLNLKVEKPSDYKAFVAENSGMSKLAGECYGTLRIEGETWYLKTHGDEWEVWSCVFEESTGDGPNFLIYFPTPFHGVIFDRVNKDNHDSTAHHAKGDVNILQTTQFKAMETLHILQDVLQIGGIRKQMVNNYMETLTDSLLKELDISGIKLLESLTHNSMLALRAAPIHIQLVKLILAECHKKTNSR